MQMVAVVPAKMLLRLTLLVRFEILLLCQWAYSQDCIDKASNCVLRKQLGLCATTPLWENCLKTCERCPSAGCADLWIDCSQRKVNNQCPALKIVCRKTCGYCATSDVTSTDEKPTAMWSQWSTFGKCSKKCGGGLQTRIRTCSVEGSCPGISSDSRKCNQKACSEKSYSSWTKYGKCSVTCGRGTRSRTRTCLKRSCNQRLIQEKNCNARKCPVEVSVTPIPSGIYWLDSKPGRWGKWGKYQPCSKSCGGGTTIRTRTCSKPGACKGPDKQSKRCRRNRCKGKWNKWTAWSSCSEKCGSGKQGKTRSCQGKEKCMGEMKRSRFCNTKPCQSSSEHRTTWLLWENWGGCSKPCGPGFRTRIRICSVSEGCSGQSVQKSRCRLRTCSTEISYSPCSRTCGDGIQKKLESSGEYSTRHCKLRRCPHGKEFCPHNQKERYKNPDKSCCLKTSSSLCGVSSSTSYQSELRVLGGTNSAIGDWPWMVFLTGPLGYCGGALLSSKYILTAAHCLQKGGEKPDVNSFTVGVGFADLTNRQGKSYALARYVVYPLYSLPKHDIGILELKSAVAFNDYIRPICLPHGEEPPYDSTCITMGWGVSVKNGLNQITQILQNADLRVFDPDVCVHGYNNPKYPTLAKYLPFLKTRRGYVCSGDLVNATDSCRGDSGSPLVCQRCKNCGWYVVGVTSFGSKPCALEGIPGVYTKVTDYEEWIYHVTGISKESWTC